MRIARTLGLCALGLVSLTRPLDGQTLSSYRGFELGSDLASVSGLAGLPAADAKMLHERPVRLQELEWRPSRWTAGSSAPSIDAVQQIAFGFYDDQLFRLVVQYGRQQTEGMTDADMIEAISATYGTSRTPARAAVRQVYRLEIESGVPIARWGGPEYAVVLYRSSSYGESFRLIMTDVRLEGLAQKAEARALVLDDQEAPQREIARQKTERDAARTAGEKARIANKATFRP
jgi:hypothetical protein